MYCMYVFLYLACVSAKLFMLLHASPTGKEQAASGGVMQRTMHAYSVINGSSAWFVHWSTRLYDN